MRKLLTTVVALVCMLVQVFGQKKITGKVTDDAGKPVVNASVQVKGTSVGAVTSEDGSFSLTVPANANTLVISSVGMEDRQISITGSTVYSVTLRTLNAELDEVVVVGYGTGRKLGTVVGSVARVDAKDIQQKPNANAFDALQGKVAGLTVFTSSGEPSASSSVRLHGVGSLGSSSTPLYVLDGIPIDGGTVISLNPEDFESVTVLKDASATSIYGSRAANGVIYITTKKGKSGAPVINVQSQYGISNMTSNTKDYFDGFMNTKQLTDFWLAIGYRTQAQIDALLTAYPNDTRWGDVFYKKDVSHYKLDFNVSGGGGKTSYYISGGYFKQEGLAYRSDYKRYTLRSNVTSALNDWMKVGLNLSMGLDERQTNPYGSNQLNRGLAILNQPFYTPIDPATGEEYKLIPGLNRYHPHYLSENILSQADNTQFNPSGYIQLTPLKGLTIKSQAGMDAYDYRSSGATLPSYLGSGGTGSASESFTRGISKTVNNTIEYQFKVAEDHGFAVLGGQEYLDGQTTAFSASRGGFTDDRLLLLSSGTTTPSVGESKSEYSFYSYFGRLEYDYQGKYFLDATLRQDESSRFGSDKKKATFWSIGGMWDLMKEKFMDHVSWIDVASVKVSYGTSGNSAIGNYSPLGLVSSGQYQGATSFNVNAPGNNDLSWESQKQTNIGFNMGFFKKLRVQIDLYNRVTSNMLVSVPYPYTSGFTDIYSNVGSLRNRGIDVTIDADVYKTKDFIVTPYVNFNYNQNEVTELFQGNEYWIIPNTGVSWAIGQPVSFFYPIFAGVDPQTGNPQWYVPGSDIVSTTKDPNNVTSTFNSTSLQQGTGIKRQAPFAGGFGLSSRYKSLYLDVNFSFVSGKYLINNDRYFYENPSQFPGYNQASSILDYWKNPGDVTTFPRYGVQFTQFDSRLIEDASFIRMKAITLGYNLPANILSKTGFIKGVKAYVTGRNLLTFTKYSGPDPEVDSNLTLGTNPNTQQVAFGLDFRF